MTDELRPFAQRYVVALEARDAAHRALVDAELELAAARQEFELAAAGVIDASRAAHPATGREAGR